MEDSILKTVRHDAGNLEYNCDAFDGQLIPLINEAFSNLWQNKVGPKNGFAIQGTTEVWDDFTNDIIAQNWVKTYVITMTRLGFDPPQASFIYDNLKKRADENMWRLNAYTDPPEEE